MENQATLFSSKLRLKSKWGTKLRGRVVEVLRWLRINGLTPEKEMTSLLFQAIPAVEWSEIVVGDRYATKPFQTCMVNLKGNRLLLARILFRGVLK